MLDSFFEQAIYLHVIGLLYRIVFSLLSPYRRGVENVILVHSTFIVKFYAAVCIYFFHYFFIVLYFYLFLYFCLYHCEDFQNAQFEIWNCTFNNLPCTEYRAPKHY